MRGRRNRCGVLNWKEGRGRFDLSPPSTSERRSESLLLWNPSQIFGTPDCPVGAEEVSFLLMVIPPFSVPSRPPATHRQPFPSFSTYGKTSNYPPLTRPPPPPKSVRQSSFQPPAPERSLTTPLFAPFPLTGYGHRSLSVSLSTPIVS